MEKLLKEETLVKGKEKDDHQKQKQKLKRRSHRLENFFYCPNFGEISQNQHQYPVFAL